MRMILNPIIIEKDEKKMMEDIGLGVILERRDIRGKKFHQNVLLETNEHLLVWKNMKRRSLQTINAEK